MSKHPNCELLDRENAKRHTLLDFLEFLEGKGVWLCKMEAEDGWAEPGLPLRKESIVFEFLGIDENELENERRAILEEAQSQL